MVPDRVSNPGRLTYESGALLIALRGPALNYVNGVSFQGKQLCLFLFVSFLDRGQLLTERICSYRRKFFLLKVVSILEACYHPGKQTGSHKSCLS